MLRYLTIFFFVYSIFLISDCFSDKTHSPPIEESVVPICTLCFEYYANQVSFTNCPHLICQSCYDKPNVRICPVCRVPKGSKPGKVINLAHLKFVQKAEVLDDYGVTPAMVEAAEKSKDANGQRPGDREEDVYDIGNFEEPPQYEHFRFRVRIRTPSRDSLDEFRI